MDKSSVGPKWGLNVPANKKKGENEEQKKVSSSSPEARPLLSKPRKDLAEEPDSSSYASLPVSEFGAAMLSSMKLTRPLEREDSKPIQYVPRPVGLGLGASQVTDVSKLKQRKPVELALGLKLDAEEERVFKSKSPGNEMLSRHANYVGIDERAPKRIKLVIEVGSKVSILSGRHQGLTGKVVKASKDGLSWMVELDVNREIVLVDKRDVQLAALQKPEKQTESERKADNSASWLFPGLKVRIVSKNSFERGKFYNVKGIILDVHGHSECSLRLLSSSSASKEQKILPAVPQWALETCVPRQADPTRATVLYLKAGDYCHSPFRILQLDDSKSEAVIQLEDDFTVVICAKYDDICEFVQIY